VKLDSSPWSSHLKHVHGGCRIVGTVGFVGFCQDWQLGLSCDCHEFVLHVIMRPRRGCGHEVQGGEVFQG